MSDSPTVPPANSAAAPAPAASPPPGCPAHVPQQGAGPGGPAPGSDPGAGPGGVQRLYGPGVAADPMAVYDRLRAEHGAVAPVLLEGDVPAWLVLGYEEILHVTRNPRRFSRDGRNWREW